MGRNEDIFFADESKSGLETLKEAMAAFLKNGSRMMLPAVLLVSSDMAFGQNDSFSLVNQLVIVAEKNKTTEAVAGEESFRVWNRLQELAQLKDGWDGSDSKQIRSKVIEHFQEILFRSSDLDFKDWVLFPEAHGYLYLDYSHQDNMAGISLTENDFSFFVIRNGETEKGENIPYRPENVISVLRQFNG